MGTRAAIDLSFLPAPVRRDLELHCQVTKERPEDVIIDALTFHLDELAGDCTSDADVAEQLREAVQ